MQQERYFYAFRLASLSAGPVWTLQLGNPDTVGPGQCDAAPIFDGLHLYLASNGTTINGTAYDGSAKLKWLHRIAHRQHGSDQI